ncbi:PaaI family thioesterase [Bifidobacterium sp. ESL0704]|uniref:PaaI family thioesterase n=1 Tax=Bifidobacterium sp. ESL0704 TaxID=2983219 RepID=UPI0023F7891B|nr:PaaI family thioesterase [Bifidobacterium sp. ESL0704]WEV52900.1 PaaI family thioesterase [Bifidobacterium sp. ESL0704]
MSFANYLGIRQQEISATKVILTLPVTENLLQPFGALHGGVNAVLAEEAASLGALARLDKAHVPVGIDVSTHHFRPVSSGTLTATATPDFVGRTTQTWRVEVRMGSKLTSVSTVTLAVRERR